MDVSLREYPDLRVTEIGDPPLGLRPGQKIDVSWTIINEGNSDTRRDWVDYVYLSDDVAAINDDFVDGSEDVTITAEATDYEAHTAALRISEDDQPALTVTIGAAIFAENVANPATTATVSIREIPEMPLILGVMLSATVNKMSLIASSGNSGVGLQRSEGRCFSVIPIPWRSCALLGRPRRHRRC